MRFCSADSKGSEEGDIFDEIDEDDSDGEAGCFVFCNADSMFLMLASICAPLSGSASKLINY